MIGTQIRTIRKEKKLKQQDLANLTGLTQEYISRLEQGKALTPDYYKIIKIFAAMGYRYKLERFVLDSWDTGLVWTFDEEKQRWVGERTYLVGEPIK